MHAKGKTETSYTGKNKISCFKGCLQFSEMMETLINLSDVSICDSD